MPSSTCHWLSNDECWGQIKWTTDLDMTTPRVQELSYQLWWALHADLGEYWQSHPKVNLLQYVDELLISVETLEACKATSDGMLGTLRDLGYRIPAKKSQLCQTKVTYLGYILKEGKRWLSNARKETVLRISRHRNHWEVREFLKSAGL